MTVIERGRVAFAANRRVAASERGRGGHLNDPPNRRGRALDRSAFAAYILQGPVRIALALALRPVSLPAEIKAPGGEPRQSSLVLRPSEGQLVAEE